MDPSTTLSAAEYTHAGGVTDETTKIKGGVWDPRVLPRTVINDPLLALETPDWLWVTTGMRALDHAIECAYAIRHQPISDALAAKSISLMVKHLPASIRAEGSARVAHRGHCQFAVTQQAVTLFPVRDLGAPCRQVLLIDNSRVRCHVTPLLSREAQLRDGGNGAHRRRERSARRGQRSRRDTNELHASCTIECEQFC